MTRSFESSLKTVLYDATEDVSAPGISVEGVVREASRRRTRRRGFVAAGACAVLVASVVTAIQLADQGRRAAPLPPASTEVSTPTPTPEPTPTQEVVADTQPEWDPRRVDDLPAPPAGFNSLLPAVLEPPESSPLLSDDPIDAAVAVVFDAGWAQVLSRSHEWRTVPIPGENAFVELSPMGTRMVVSHYADGPGDEVSVFDLSTGASHQVAYPEGFVPWDTARVAWADEDTLVITEKGGGILVDAETGESEEVPYPTGFSWSVDPDGVVVETSDWGSPAEFTDWAGGSPRRVSESLTGRLSFLLADRDTVVGTSYDGRPYSVVLADRATLTPRVVLPVNDYDGNYSNGGLGTVAIRDDGSVLLRVAVFGRNSSTRIVNWEPSTGALSLVSDVQVPVGNGVTFADGQLRWTGRATVEESADQPSESDAADRRAMNAYIEWISQRYVTDYAGMWFTEDNGQVAHFRFVGAVPEEVRARLPEGVRAEFLDDGLATPRAAEAMVNAVRRLVDGVSSLSVNYDVASQRILVEAPAAARGQVEAALLPYDDPIPVRVDYFDAAPQIDFQSG